MKVDAFASGVVISVPEGADAVRRSAYCMLVKRTLIPPRRGLVVVEGQRVRGDDQPLPRRNVLGWAAWLNPVPCKLITPSTRPLCIFGGCYERAQWRGDPDPRLQESVFCDAHRYVGENTRPAVRRARRVPR